MERRSLEGWLFLWWDEPERCGSHTLSEGFTRMIQSLKAAARGLYNVANYRIGILFFFSKLNLNGSTASLTYSFSNH